MDVIYVQYTHMFKYVKVDIVAGKKRLCPWL
jgi:hypothetical protein